MPEPSRFEEFARLATEQRNPRCRNRGRGTAALDPIVALRQE